MEFIEELVKVAKILKSLGLTAVAVVRVIVPRRSGHGNVVGKDGDKRPSCSLSGTVVAEEVGVSGSGMQIMEEMVGIAEFLSFRGPEGAAVKERGPIQGRGLGWLAGYPIRGIRS